MITTRIVGGLGNQMFQYAAGYSLADRLATNLRLDLSAFRRYELHRFGLDRLRISHRQGAGWVAPVRRALLARLPAGRMPRSYFRERSLGYDNRWASLRDGVYLDGYFQSERYFSSVREALRREFQPVDPLDDRSRATLADIEAGPSVAVHIRRGDYVSDPKTLSVHGVCDPSYYAQAVRLLAARIGSARYFVFSNDFEWVARHVPLPAGYVPIDWNGDAPERDLHLMARCRHHVIANSTFSWWGAWLAAQAGQLVVRPEPWFDAADLSADDLLPRHWTALPKRQRHAA